MVVDLVDSVTAVRDFGVADSEGALQLRPRVELSRDASAVQPLDVGGTELRQQVDLERGDAEAAHQHGGTGSQGKTARRDVAACHGHEGVAVAVRPLEER